ncbi:MAG: TetR/AcrR family transcriptional regulator [Proteobacteria bacterium]|nr:TetR/AcrR family transcriptional regulator [Pseudomonadota bacterium]MBU1743019.1 TetR/AcrR family transcriptional regulator [Pseudomonadota bacterium]
MGIAERKEREKRRRRARIMNAAKKVFTDKGFGGATMEEIALEAELSPATLYLYFKNKNDLYASLNLKMLEFLVWRLEELRDQEGLDAEGRVRGLADALYDVYQNDPLILFNVFHLQSTHVLTELPPETLDEINGLSARALRIMAGIFQQGIDEGVFADRAAIALADTVWAVFTGLVLWEESKRLFDSGKDFLKPTLDLAIETIVQGIKKG